MKFARWEKIEGHIMKEQSENSGIVVVYPFSKNKL